MPPTVLIRRNVISTRLPMATVSGSTSVISHRNRPPPSKSTTAATTGGESENASRQNVANERVRLRERVAQLVEDPAVIDSGRLELEIALLSEKLDITEECVRFHLRFSTFGEKVN